MAWDVVSKETNSLLTSANVNQLQLNFTALAQQNSGAPTLSPTSMTILGVGSFATINVASGMSVTQPASFTTLDVASSFTCQVASIDTLYVSSGIIATIPSSFSDDIHISADLTVTSLSTFQGVQTDGVSSLTGVYNTGNYTTDGRLTIDVDGAAASTGSLTLGAGGDATIWFDGTDLQIATDGAGAGGIKLDSEDDTIEILGSGAVQATFDTSGLNLVSGDAYYIDSTSVLNATTLGSGVTGSSLTSLGTLTSLKTSGTIATGSEASPDVVTGGLCLNIASNVGVTQSFKSDLGNHGMTTVAEADTHAFFMKVSQNHGGLRIAALGASSDNRGFWVDSYLNASDTTNTTTSQGAIYFNSALTDGTGVQDFGSTANIFSISNNKTARMLLKGDGDMHITNTTLTALDDYNDIELARNLQLATGGERYKHLVSKEDFDKLVELKALTSEGDFQIMQGVNAVTLGAISQLFNALRGISERLGITKDELIDMAKTY